MMCEAGTLGTNEGIVLNELPAFAHGGKLREAPARTRAPEQGGKDRF